MEGHTENGHIDLYQKLTFTPPPQKKKPFNLVFEERHEINDKR